MKWAVRDPMNLNWGWLAGVYTALAITAISRTWFVLWWAFLSFLGLMIHHHVLYPYYYENKEKKSDEIA